MLSLLVLFMCAPAQAGDDLDTTETITTTTTTTRVSGEPRRRGGPLLAAGLITVGVTVPVGMGITAAGAKGRSMGPALIGTSVGGVGVLVGGTLAIIGGTQLAITSGRVRRHERGVAVGPAGISGRF